MNRFRFYLGRVFRIIGGFVLAVICGCAVVLVFGFNNGRMPEMSLGALALWGATLGLVSAYGAQFAAPALVAALVGEVMHWRAVWFHAGLGLAAAGGAYIYYLAEELELTAHPLTSTLFAGLLGGLVYWLVAGRSAGLAPSPEAPS